jgi:hypothetical protein
METRNIILGNSEKGKLVNIARILFGAICIAVAAYWLIFSIKETAGTGSIWITVAFLAGFGFYLIWAGMGKADRFITIRNDSIILKKYIFLPPSVIQASETALVEFYSLKVRFMLRSGKDITLRFGTTYYETNEKIFDYLEEYCSQNKIEIKEISEEI